MATKEGRGSQGAGQSSLQSADRVSSSSDANEEEHLGFPVFLHLLSASVFLLFHFFPILLLQQAQPHMLPC